MKENVTYINRNNKNSRNKLQHKEIYKNCTYMRIITYRMDKHTYNVKEIKGKLKFRE